MRIVAGKYKGLNLNTFNCEAIRPTPDKVRESIFNTVQFEIVSSDFLDLFGGTGAVGLEARSRGAIVVVCESNEKSIEIIKGNYLKAKEKPELLVGDYTKTLQFLFKKGRKFDFIFLDPPFKSEYGIKAINLISEYDLLKKNGLIIYEHLKSDGNVLVENYEEISYKVYGTIAVSYLKREKA